MSKFLKESEIVALEERGRELVPHLLQLSQEKLADITARLLTSYRLAARVANAAWKKEKAASLSEKVRAASDLQRCLVDYAPNNFSHHLGEIETLVEEFTSLHAEMEGLSPDECRELVQSRLEMFEDQLRTIRSRVPRTPVT